MKKPDDPKDLNLQTFLMCVPFESSYNNKVKNNPLMKDNIVINYNKAFKQWISLYRYISQNGLVYLLPNKGDFQDIIYVANMGLVLHHIKEPTVILSNFTSPPRKGEESVGRLFFEGMNYNCIKSPFKFEGEADCKYVRDNIYAAAYGIRSDARSYQWMTEQYNCNIIPVHMTDKKLYHFDCIFFPLNDQTALVNTSALFDSDISKLEKVVDIVDVPKALKYTGITNLARVGPTILCRDLEEKNKSWLNNICNKYGLDVVYFPLEEFDSNGSDLSCMVMHMNKPFRPSGTSVVAGIRNFFKC